MDKQQTTGDALLSLRRDVLKAYEHAHTDKVTMPAAFGLAAHMVQTALECDFRVACLLTDCWLTEHANQKPPPPT